MGPNGSESEPNHFHSVPGRQQNRQQPRLRNHSHEVFFADHPCPVPPIFCTHRTGSSRWKGTSEDLLHCQLLRKKQWCQTQSQQPPNLGPVRSVSQYVLGKFVKHQTCFTCQVRNPHYPRPHLPFTFPPSTVNSQQSIFLKFCLLLGLNPRVVIGQSYFRYPSLSKSKKDRYRYVQVAVMQLKQFSLINLVSDVLRHTFIDSCFGELDDAQKLDNVLVPKLNHIHQLWTFAARAAATAASLLSFPCLVYRRSSTTQGAKASHVRLKVSQGNCLQELAFGIMRDLSDWVSQFPLVLVKSVNSTSTSTIINL